MIEFNQLYQHVYNELKLILFAIYTRF